jgi:hypothetical protein
MSFQRRQSNMQNSGLIAGSFALASPLLLCLVAIEKYGDSVV